MWFAPEQIATDALRRIIRCNRNRLEVEMSELFLEVMENTQTDSLQFCLNDAIALLQCNHVKAEKYLVRKIVQDCWKLQPSENALTYTSLRVQNQTEFLMCHKVTQKTTDRRHNSVMIDA